MEKVDFSKDQLIINLINPIFYIDPKKREQIVLDAVEIQRMNTPQLNSFKTKVAQVSAKLGSLSFMIPFFQILCKVGVVRFYSERVPVQVHDKDQVVDMLPFESAYKVGIYIMMHLRETSFLAGSYKCKKCGKTNIFDIDPESAIPDDDPSRSHMLDYLDYVSEVKNIEKKQSFTYTLTKPVQIDVPKDVKAANFEWEKVEIDTFKFTYPTIKIYSDIAQNQDRAVSSDFYALYDSLIEIGDYDRTITHKIKLKNTINKIFNFKNTEFKKILDAYQEFKFINEFYYDCLHCGETNEDNFDMTNFFEFLKS